jgi:hypothetical protein
MANGSVQHSPDIRFTGISIEDPVFDAPTLPAFAPTYDFVVEHLLADINATG